MTERQPPQSQGRFVCLACRVELRCVRIGVWRCPQCAVVGPLTFDDNGFTVAHVPAPHWDLATPEVFRRGRLRDIYGARDPERATP